MCKKACRAGDKGPEDFIEFLAFLSWLGDKIEDDEGKTHQHKCPDIRCGRVWSHSYAEIKDDPDAGHRCPDCGTEQWKRYKCGKANDLCKPSLDS